MAKSQETFNKKEKEKKKQQKRKEKEQRLAERRANAKEGKSLEEMMAYVDANGNITNTPPDPTAKKIVVKEEDIVIGSRNMEGVESNTIRKGRVMSFNSAKGYGFIKDEQTQESLFVHTNSLTSPIKENDRVTFETQRGNKGLSAVNVKKIS
jgi:cold shock CspA family protein